MGCRATRILSEIKGDKLSEDCLKEKVLKTGKLLQGD